jgi:hypothetical protein
MLKKDPEKQKQKVCENTEFLDGGGLTSDVRSAGALISMNLSNFSGSEKKMLLP